MDVMSGSDWAPTSATRSCHAQKQSLDGFCDWIHFHVCSSEIFFNFFFFNSHIKVFKLFVFLLGFKSKLKFSYLIEVMSKVSHKFFTFNYCQSHTHLTRYVRWNFKMYKERKISFKGREKCEIIKKKTLQHKSWMHFHSIRIELK